MHPLFQRDPHPIPWNLEILPCFLGEDGQKLQGVSTGLAAYSQLINDTAGAENVHYYANATNADINLLYLYYLPTLKYTYIRKTKRGLKCPFRGHSLLACT